MLINNRISERTTIPQQSLSHITLNEILKAIPNECFQQVPWKAWGYLVINLSLVALAYWLLTVAPIWVQPILCFLTGTILTGSFVLAHDCGHYSFAKQRWVNHLVGQLLLLPLLYPFENWRIRHNSHHAHTNKLGGKGWKQLIDVRDRKADPAWFPLRPNLWKQLSLQQRLIFWLFRGPLWWLGSVVNWWHDELILNRYTPLSSMEQTRTRVSVVAVLGFSVCFFPILIYFTGFEGFIKYWLLPWLVFHGWMSVFTRIQHSSSELPWKSGKQWSVAESQLRGTVHCDYPFGIEFLCHHINVHIPHHLSVRIPHYHLRKAHQSLKEKWGESLQETTFSVSLFKQMGALHLYDEITEDYRALSLNEVLYLKADVS